MCASGPRSRRSPAECRVRPQISLYGFCFGLSEDCSPASVSPKTAPLPSAVSAPAALPLACTPLELPSPTAGHVLAYRGTCPLLRGEGGTPREGEAFRSACSDRRSERSSPGLVLPWNCRCLQGDMPAGGHILAWRGTCPLLQEWDVSSPILDPLLQHLPFLEFH